MGLLTYRGPRVAGLLGIGAQPPTTTASERDGWSGFSPAPNLQPALTNEEAEIVVTARPGQVARAKREWQALQSVIASLVDPLPAPTWRGGGRMNRASVQRRAEHAMRMYDLHRSRGMNPEQAAGWAANAEAESAGDYRRDQDPGPGYGLFQWGADAPQFDRRRDFQRRFGHPIQNSTEDEQLRFRDWELANTEQRASRRIERARTAGDAADAITRYYERPARPDRDAADRANVAEEIARRARARQR